MSVEAIVSTDIYNGSSAQTVQMMIVDIDKNTLVTPIGSVNKALLSLNAKNCLSALSGLDTRSFTTSGYGWLNLGLRAFLRGNFYNAISSEMKARIKEVNRSFTSNQTPSTVQDTVFILSEEETQGGFSYYNSGERRIKNFNGSANNWWTCTEKKYADGTGLCSPNYINNSGKFNIKSIINYINNSNNEKKNSKINNLTLGKNLVNKTENNYLNITNRTKNKQGNFLVSYIKQKNILNYVTNISSNHLKRQSHQRNFSNALRNHLTNFKTDVSNKSNTGSISKNKDKFGNDSLMNNPYFPTERSVNNKYIMNGKKGEFGNNKSHHKNKVI
jgi:ribosomal protein S15P/S13E